MLLGNSFGQTVHTHHASVHQAAKLVAALLRVVEVTAGLVESNGSLPPGISMIVICQKSPNFVYKNVQNWDVSGIKHSLCSLDKYSMHLKFGPPV